MGTTGFWTTPGTPWEPKMQWRWRVYIKGLGMEDSTTDANRDLEDKDVGDGLAWYAKTIDKPKMTFGTANEGLANVGQMTNDMFVAGPPKWSPVSMTLVDPTEPNATRKLLRWVRRAGYKDEKAAKYNFGKWATPYGAFSAAEFEDSIGEIRIEQLDPGAPEFEGFTTPLETWRLMGPWVQEIDFGTLDYSADSPVEIKITFGYVYATCMQHGIAGTGDSPHGPAYWNSVTEEFEESPERTFLYFRDVDPKAPDAAATPAPDDAPAPTGAATTGNGNPDPLAPKTET